MPTAQKSAGSRIDVRNDGLSLDAYTQNFAWVYWRGNAEDYLRQQGASVTVDFNSIKIIIANTNIYAKSLRQPTLSKATNDLKAWLESNAKKKKLSAAEIRSYYAGLKTLSDSWYALRNRDMLVVPMLEQPEECEDLLLFWPGLDFDIRSARSCLGLGHSTAAVFHLSRALEGALQGLAKRYKIPGWKNQTWQTLTDRLNAKLRSMSLATENARATHRQLAIALSHLNATRIAWRNDVMHPGGEYTVVAARAIWNNVTSALREIAPLVARPTALPTAPSEGAPDTAEHT